MIAGESPGSKLDKARKLGVKVLDEAAFTKLLDDLSANHEARLLPKKPWTRAKMTPGRFDGMLKAIEAYELEIEALRGTAKMGQNNSAAEMAGAAAGLEVAGRTSVATLMRAFAEAKR